MDAFAQAKQRRIEKLTQEVHECEATKEMLQFKVKRYEQMLDAVFRAHEYRDARTIEQTYSAFCSIRDTRNPLDNVNWKPKE